MKVLITGAGGQLGTALVRVCTAAGDDVIAADRASLDIAVRDQVLGSITALAPDVVVSVGAWTAVDDCEADPSRAFATNALGVRHLAEGCRLAGAHLLHVSTDYVFDGSLERPYNEWDATNPRSVYGASKLAGEREAIDGCPGAAILRTAWVVGPHGSNMLRTILRLAGDPDRELAFVDDQVGNPTFSDDLAALLRRIAVTRAPGIFHGTNQGSTSWFGFAQAVLAAAGHNPDRVRPISTSELTPPRAAPRPANSCLAAPALTGAGFDLLDDFHVPLERTVAALT